MMTARALHALIVLLVLPLLMLRGRTLRAWFAVDAATWVLAAVLWPQRHGLDAYLAAVALVAAKVATLALFVAVGKEVRWSAGRAAVAALLVYSLLVPAMQRTPPDGDEPYYLLVTESIIRDFDLDLANQYGGDAARALRRLDLRPQPGDPTGPRGELYSRHEPFLSILLIPGYAAAGLGGALATMILFAALLVRSTIRFLEDEGIDEATARIVFPFVAFAPPVVFYAARIWPEVPAAFLFVEAIRGVRNRRPQRWIAPLVALALLKLRFVLVAVPLAARAIVRSRRHLPVVLLIVAIPLLVAWLVSGSATNVHSVSDLIAPGYGGPLHGLFGLLLDSAAGLLFQAPFYLLGVFGVVRWRQMPEGFRIGCLSALLYIVLLVPRSEWHGGWSPPLRYIVFLMPVLALGAATLLRNGRFRSALAVAAVWTAGLVIHGVAHPWRLFHIANGEWLAGEWLSGLYGADYSRLFPSFIRLNFAAVVAAVALTVALAAFALLRRSAAVPMPVVISATALLMAAAFVAGAQPGKIVHFEDAHVQHLGGDLHPPLYTVARFAYRGGWILHAGQSLSFNARRGPATLHFVTGLPSVIEVGERRYELGPAEGYRTLRVQIDEPGRVVLRCLSGGVNLDRLESD
jgi:hypothetical protein